MKFSLLLSLLSVSWLMAGNLVVSKGSVNAHTEVFGDSTINPSTENLTSHLTMNKSIETIKGTINISVQALKSDNAKRDEHMAEAIESTKYPLATYTFKNVTKDASGYKVDGILDFHGVKKPLTLQANITQKDDKVNFTGKTSFLMSSYGIKPPTMFFLTVRDQVDIDVDVLFTKQ
jgi:polyisoprenoid-binding protein YceI